MDGRIGMRRGGRRAVRGRRISEVVWLGLGFALMGLVFGAGYAHTHRDAAV